MSDIKITELAAATLPLAGTELVEVVQSGANKQAPVSALATSPYGSNGDIQINNSGVFGSITPGAGVATFLTTPSGGNLASALTSALTIAKGGTGATSLAAGLVKSNGTICSSTGLGTGLQYLRTNAGATDVEWGDLNPAAQTISALNIDWSLTGIFTKTLAAGGNTFTFSNATSGRSIIVRLTSNGGGSTVTWPTVKWKDGTPPTQTATGTDVYTFFHDGTNIYGSVVQNFS